MARNGKTGTMAAVMFLGVILAAVIFAAMMYSTSMNKAYEDANRTVPQNDSGRVAVDVGINASAGLGVLFWIAVIIVAAILLIVALIFLVKLAGKI